MGISSEILPSLFSLSPFFSPQSASRRLYSGLLRQERRPGQIRAERHELRASLAPLPGAQLPAVAGEGGQRQLPRAGERDGRLRPGDSRGGCLQADGVSGGTPVGLQYRDWLLPGWGE